MCTMSHMYQKEWETTTDNCLHQKLWEEHLGFLQSHGIQFYSLKTLRYALVSGKCVATEIWN